MYIDEGNPDPDNAGAEADAMAQNEQAAETTVLPGTEQQPSLDNEEGDGTGPGETAIP